MNLSEYLKKKREQNGLTQREVASRLGYTTSQFVSNWERGLSTPPKSALPDIVEMYDLNPKELLRILLNVEEASLRTVLLTGLRPNDSKGRRPLARPVRTVVKRGRRH